jgi:hypothetical protein
MNAATDEEKVVRTLNIKLECITSSQVLKMMQTAENVGGWKF